MHMVHHLDITQALTLLLPTDGLNGEILNVAAVSYTHLTLPTILRV